ncbi:MAG TPA: hypothetical protein VHA75_08000 [Rugosimonospora sp.]|nr:hypothetical protein [Rugosimonospora sp.]
MNDYLTVREIADGTGLSMAAVYALAYRQRWRRTKSKPIGYATADVLASLARRA